MHNLLLLVFNHALKLQKSVCHGCQNLLILSLNISDVYIITVKSIDYCFNVFDISKYNAIHLLENFVLDNRAFI